MSIWMVVGLVILCAAAGDAAAERAVVVDAVGVPFEARELAAAIRVRVAADGAPLRIRATATAHGVRIEAPGGGRDVELGGLRGAEAARLVALVADDLLLDDLAVPPAPVRHPGLAVLGAVAGWSSALPEVALDLTLPRAGWLIAIELGGGQLIDRALNLSTAVARLGVGRRFGLIEARAGLTAAPVIVTTGVGDQTVLVGASGSARIRVPLADTVHLIAAIGCDAFATRTQYQLIGGAMLSTPRFAPWLAAGIEVGL